MCLVYFVGQDLDAIDITALLSISIAAETHASSYHAGFVVKFHV